MNRVIQNLTPWINETLKNVLQFDEQYLCYYDAGCNKIILKPLYLNNIFSKQSQLKITDPSDYNKVDQNINKYLNLDTRLPQPLLNNSLISKLFSDSGLEKQFKQIIYNDLEKVDNDIIDIIITLNIDNILIELIRKIKPCFIKELPNEIINEIVGYLSLKEANHFMVTDKNFLNILDNNIYWYNHFIKSFPLISAKYQNKYLYKHLLETCILVKPIIYKYKGKQYYNEKSFDADVFIEYLSGNKTYIDKYEQLSQYLVYNDMTINIDAIINNDTSDTNLLLEYICKKVSFKDVDKYLDIDSEYVDIKDIIVEDENIFKILLLIEDIKPLQLLFSYIEYERERFEDIDDYSRNRFVCDIKKEILCLASSHKNNNLKDYLDLMYLLPCFENDAQNYLWSNYKNILSENGIKTIFEDLCKTGSTNFKLIVEMSNLDIIRSSYLS